MTTEPRPARPIVANTTVLKRLEISSDLWLMWVAKPEGYDFKAGQYCTLGIDGIERAYSIVSAPFEDTLELFVELVPPPDGNLTPLLHRLKTGDKISIRPRAKGIFTFDPTHPVQVFVATVTGVVPYVSILRQYLYDGARGHRFFLLFGASYTDELGYDDELRRIAAAFPDLLTFVPTISRPDEKRNAHWQGETGRVNTIVEKYLTQWSLAPEDTLVYACGNPSMIEDVKQRMMPRGFDVHEERFWKDE
ncbi:MAG: ferredoxin--NADP(+) reductase [Chloroflexi bacterium]|nr:ferredoxin--NADP(+) reductase [Chloroflexota bacterium]MDP6798936.1 ferredoxin--NADP reductase [SAR202 cluster bacterium]MQG58814.1 ferredoxin--NADP reductase [SAR202 cluster bacterium]